MKRAEAWFVRLNQWALVVLVGAMALLVFLNVVCRYLLGFSLIWVEELTRYMMVWLGFLGAGLVLRFGAHVAVDFFQDLLPPAAARAVRAAIVVLLVFTFAALAWLGVRYAAFAWGQETAVLNWSTGAIYLAVPVGAALMLAHLFLIAREYIAARRFEKGEALYLE